jgi:hypothetical protein
MLHGRMQHLQLRGPQRDLWPRQVLEQIIPILGLLSSQIIPVFRR